MPDKLLFILSKIVHRLSGYFNAVLKQKGMALSPGPIGIILVLDKEKQTTMGALSQALEMDNAALTRLVDKLEQKQIVSREINPADRRKILIRITQKGLSWSAEVKQVIETVNRQIKAGFTTEELEIYQRVNQDILQKFQ